MCAVNLHLAWFLAGGRARSRVAIELWGTGANFIFIVLFFIKIHTAGYTCTDKTKKCRYHWFINLLIDSIKCCIAFLLEVAWNFCKKQNSVWGLNRITCATCLCVQLGHMFPLNDKLNQVSELSRGPLGFLVHLSVQSSLVLSLVL